MDPEKKQRLTRYILVSAFAIGVVWLVIALDEVFGPLLFALLLAYILNPVVNWIQARRVSRVWAIVILFVAFYACLVGFVAVTVPALLTQVGSFYEASVGEATYDKHPQEEKADKDRDRKYRRLPEDGPPGMTWYFDENRNLVWDRGYVRLIADWIGRLKKRMEPEGDLSQFSKGVESVQEYLAAHSEALVDASVNAAKDAVFGVFSLLTAFILIPIYLFYFLMGFRDIRDRTREMLPGRYRERIVSILGRIDEAVSAFFRGRLIIMFIKGAIMAGALTIVGLPYALLLGVITGAGSLIPVAGFLIGIVPSTLIALFEPTGGLGAAIAVVVIFIVVEIFENYALTPWVLKDRVGLHPVTILVSVFAAGALFGFIGMLLSVPIASVAKILYSEFVDPNIKALAAEKPESPSPPGN